MKKEPERIVKIDASQSFEAVFADVLVCFRKSLGDIGMKLEEIQQLQPELVERFHPDLRTQTAQSYISLRVLLPVLRWPSC